LLCSRTGIATRATVELSRKVSRTQLNMQNGYAVRDRRCR
jgi:hypothetical protein